MNTWDIEHTCTFTGHRPEYLELPGYSDRIGDSN